MKASWSTSTLTNKRGAQYGIDTSIGRVDGKNYMHFYSTYNWT